MTRDERLRTAVPKLAAMISKDVDVKTIADA
jgi:hypothetical protein